MAFVFSAVIRLQLVETLEETYLSESVLRILNNVIAVYRFKRV